MAVRGGGAGADPLHQCHGGRCQELPHPVEVELEEQDRAGERDRARGHPAGLEVTAGQPRAGAQDQLAERDDEDLPVPLGQVGAGEDLTGEFGAAEFRRRPADSGRAEVDRRRDRPEQQPARSVHERPGRPGRGGDAEPEEDPDAPGLDRAVHPGTGDEDGVADEVDAEVRRDEEPPVVGEGARHRDRHQQGAEHDQQHGGLDDR